LRSNQTNLFNENKRILIVLLESNLYGRQAPTLDNKRLHLALDAIDDFKDRNIPDIDNTPIKTFWPPVYNEALNMWQLQQDNLVQLSLNFDKLPWYKIQNLLRLIKLEVLANNIEFFKQFVNFFQCISDFDDSYLNIGLGATLKKLRDIYPNAYEKWSKQNRNMQVLFDYTAKYFYNPFDSDPNKSLIDPRTYFYARPFLLEAQNKNQSLSLITTWIANASEGIPMAFNVNNIDVAVCANSIYGIASGAIYNVNNFQSLFLSSPQMQQTFLNTTKFLSWAIKTNYTKRPDLALLYYPSNYNFLWYASRILFLLTNELAQTQNPIDEPLRSIMTEAYDYLHDTFEDYVTNGLIGKAKHDHDHSESYFDDFLGLNDTNEFGEVVPTGEDRIFSTSQAINILLATWTYQDSTNKKLMWKHNTPDAVPYLINSSVKWLQTNVFNENLKPLNAFFSSSVKHRLSVPFYYPANYYKFLNGTSVDPSEMQPKEIENMIIGMKGVIDERDYQAMLSKSHFGVKTPVDFMGYNVKDNYFPFWSSNAYTYSVALLALSQYNNIHFQDNIDL
jgi:hypothetical protein